MQSINSDTNDRGFIFCSSNIVGPNVMLWFTLHIDFFKHCAAMPHISFRVLLLVSFTDIYPAPRMSLHMLKVATLK